MRLSRISVGAGLVVALAAGCTSASPGTSTPTSKATTASAKSSPHSTTKPTSKVRTITVSVNAFNLPGTNRRGVRVNTDKLAVGLVNQFNVSSGWDKANIKFVAQAFGGQIRVTPLNQFDINNLNLGGCHKPDADCAGPDLGQPPICYVAFTYTVSKSGQITGPSTGVVQHEAGHCLFGIKHRPGDPLMRAARASQIAKARPSAEMLGELRKRPDDHLILPASGSSQRGGLLPAS